MTVVVAYIPVVHRGYLEFLADVQPQEVWLLGADVIAEFPHLRKDVRALTPEQIKTSLEALNLPFSVQILSLNTISDVLAHQHQILMPDEDIMRQLASRHFTGEDVEFRSVFLRWDTQSALAEKPVDSDQTLPMNEFTRQMMQQATELAAKSGDWWRQVGAVIVQQGKVVGTGFNHHVPYEQISYENGDPRGSFHRGENLDKSTSIHAEGFAIAEAAKKGVGLDGAELFVTTFPCPYCAKLVAYSGIKKVYFAQGYAMVDGESILKDQGVEIIKLTEDV